MESYSEICLDSRHRAFGTLDAPTFFISPSIEAKYMKLKSCMIPVSFYGVDYYNCGLNFVEGTASGVSIVIPYGNYSAASLGNQIASELTAASPSGATYSCSLDADNGILSFTCSKSDFTFLSTSSIWYALGMTERANASSVSHTLVMPNIVDVSGPRYVCVRCPNVRSSSFLAGNYSNLLGTVPVTKSVGEILSYVDFSADWMELGRENMSEISLSLMDSEGHILSLNNKAFSIVVGLLN